MMMIKNLIFYSVHTDEFFYFILFFRSSLNSNHPLAALLFSLSDMEQKSPRARRSKSNLERLTGGENPPIERSGSSSPRKCIEEQKKRTITLRSVDYRTKVYTIVVVGDARIGKTTMLRSFFECSGGPFKEDTKSTKAPEYKNRMVRIPMGRAPRAVTDTGEPISPPLMFTTLTAWDTAGQERYQANMQFYYRRANAAVICIDSKDPITLQHAREQWIPRVKAERSDCFFVVALTMWDQFDVVEEYELAVQRLSERYPKSKHHSSAPTTELKRITIDEVFRELSPVIGDLSRDDIFEVSGRYGYNVNSLFLCAVQKFVRTIDAKELKQPDFKQFAIQYIGDYIREQKFERWEDFSIASLAREKMTSEGRPVPAALRTSQIFENSPSPSPTSSSPILVRKGSARRLSLRRSLSGPLAASLAAAIDSADNSAPNSAPVTPRSSNSSSPSVQSASTPPPPPQTATSLSSTSISSSSPPVPKKTDPLMVPVEMDVRNTDGSLPNEPRSGVELKDSSNRGIKPKSSPGCAC